MKYVYKADTFEGASEIKSRLEDAGIPVSISNTRFAQLRVFFIPHSLGVFVYFDSQYEDAINLINNKDHIVSNPVSIDEFYQNIESIPMQEAAHKAMNDFLFWMIAFGIVCGVLIYALS